jgi:hypothetical protein
LSLGSVELCILGNFWEFVSPLRFYSEFQPWFFSSFDFFDSSVDWRAEKVGMLLSCMGMGRLRAQRSEFPLFLKGNQTISV